MTRARERPVSYDAVDSGGAKMRVRRILAGVVAGGTLLGTLVLATASASASPIQLVLTQNQAFGILGYWCGGISEQVFATGFDPTTGYPQGDVYMRTSCSTGKAGSPPSVHTAWGSATWDYTGTTVSDAKLSAAPTYNPTFTATDAHGNTLYDQSNAAFLSLATGFVAPPRVVGMNVSQGPAAGGTSLTITGTGFTGAMAVDFAGSPDTSITVTGDTSITLTTPASAAGTDDVTVTGPGGTSADSPTFQFTFVPVPVVTSLGPDNGPVSGGNSITINGSGLSYVTSVMFGDQGAGFTVDSDTSITAFVPASDCGCPSDSSSVTVSSIGGASTPVTYNYTAVVTGTPGAPSIGTATAGDTTATVSFTAPGSDGGSPVTSYTATALDGTNPANGGQSATGGSSPLMVTGLTDGDSYTFTVTATNANGPGPASASSNAVVPSSSSPGPLAIITASIPAATRGSSYSTLLQAAGGTAPYRWRKVGLLPKGFRLRSNGALSGRPSARTLAAGMYAITVEVMTKRTPTSPAQTAEATLTLTVL